MFIVIEGLDGTGKSTAAKTLAKALGGKFLTTPLDKFKTVRPELEEIYSDESLARQLFYASTAVSSSNRVSEELTQNDCVIIDRYWLSTQVCHSWRTAGEYFLLPEVEASILKPDLTVYLNISLEERIKRLGGRSNNTEEDRLTTNVVANAKLNELYLSYSDSSFVGQWLGG
ncbi:MAG: deoxynucleoside kinase [Cycloclasticus sp.]|jgi:Thymidylate kinase